MEPFPRHSDLNSKYLKHFGLRPLLLGKVIASSIALLSTLCPEETHCKQLVIFVPWLLLS